MYIRYRRRDTEPKIALTINKLQPVEVLSGLPAFVTRNKFVCMHIPRLSHNLFMGDL